MQDRVFHLERSRVLPRLYSVVFILAELCVLVVPLYLVLKLLLTIVLIFAAAHLFGNVLPLCQPYAILSLEKKDKGRWELTCPAGTFQAVLSPDTFTSQFCIVVHFKAMSGRKLSAFICRDMLSKRAYRHLLCRLIEPPAEVCGLHQLPQR